MSPAPFAGDGLPSRLSLDVGFADEGGRSSTLDIDYGVIPELRLALTASRSGNTDFDSDSLRIAVASDPLALMQIGLSYENWDSEGQFTIETKSLLFRFNAEQWGLSITPIQRNIEFAAFNRRRQPIEVDLTSKGISLSLSYYAPGGFQAGLSYTRYDYSKDVTLLNPVNHPVLARYISPIALSQAQALDDHNYYLDFSYQFEALFFSLTIGRSQSAVDDSITKIAMINSYIPLTDEWELSAGAGLQKQESEASRRQESEASILFGNLGLSLYW